MDENTRSTDTVPAPVYDGERKKTVYVTRKKGAPGFSGRSTRTIHASCDRNRTGGKIGQQKQVRG